MEVTKVTFYPYNKKGNLRGFASVEFDEELVVTGIKLLEGSNGLFVGMPAQADSEGEYHDIAFPVTKELRKEITEAVIESYEDYDPDAKKSKKKSNKNKKSKRKDEDEDFD